MTFNQWLKQQVSRDDPVGDLARDVQADKRCIPKNTFRGWSNFLKSANACKEALETFAIAWKEYKQA